MVVKIIDKKTHSRDTLYTIRINNKTVKILYLFHAIERVKKWKLTDEMVAETLLLPEEVFTGHKGRCIAHRRYGNHIVRAIYEYEEGLPVLITVYFPYVNRYFQRGGKYEDKIL